jgi:hypothetical protein
VIVAQTAPLHPWTLLQKALRRLVESVAWSMTQTDPWTTRSERVGQAERQRDLLQQRVVAVADWEC